MERRTMSQDIKMVAVDIDGTFVHADYTYDKPRFRSICLDNRTDLLPAPGTDGR